MKRLRGVLAVTLFAFSPVVAHAQQATLRITNPTTVVRRSEVVDLPLSEISKHLPGASYISARIHGGTSELLTQKYASHVDGPVDRLLVLIDLAPRQTVLVDLTAVPDPLLLAPRVKARQVPERKDDFAWENDLVAFRVYGPALQATGEIASGIDVWSKRVPGFITESWYQRDAESERTHNPGLSYHRDNGQGLDSYEVGSSRGCGGTAVWDNGKLYPSQNVLKSRILAEGPIRVDFLLEYPPWKVGTTTVHETKRITLDAGARLNHMRSTFKFDGSVKGPSLHVVAAGIAMHHDAVLHRPQPGIVSVWDTPQLDSAGRIGTALVASPGTRPQFAMLPMEGKTAGNALFLFRIPSGAIMDYFAGTAWSKADTPTQADFDGELKNFSDRLRHPVVVWWAGSNASSSD